MTGRTHQPGYQRRDREVLDYAEYELAGTGLLFRGPDPGALPPQQQITFLGAAQTFGCFADRPFPVLVGETLGRPVRNLGYGGAGPRFYLEHPALIKEVNRGAAAVVQVMSARSEDNSLYRSGGLELLARRSDGQSIGANQAYGSFIGGYDPFTGLPRSRHLRRFTRLMTRARARTLVAETRRNWCTSYEKLLEAMTVPTILFWFSTRVPQYTPRYTSLAAMFGPFPQLVDHDMIAKLVPMADDYVSVVSLAGLPQPLVSRFDGRPTSVNPGDDRSDLGGRIWTHNRYYPSPQMHVEAGVAVAKALRRLLP